MKRRALITGITGQVGSYLAESLLADGYEVHGIIRRSSSFNTGRLDAIYKDPHEKTDLYLHFGDLADGTSLRRVLEEVHPKEVYNLAAQSHVRVSFDQPEYTADIVATGTLRLLEALRDAKCCRDAHVYQASSSEMFGSSHPPQNELTPFHPRSPYAVSKLAAHNYAINYREAYGMHVSCGIMFNAESPRRGETFVTRKVTRAVARIKLGLQDRLFLGNLDARRDWGHAKEYVAAIRRVVLKDSPDDYVIATGESHSVREWVEAAFSYADLDWKKYVETERVYMRPSEVNHLQGDAEKAKTQLFWSPTITFKQLVAEMVEHDLALARREAA